MLLLTSVNSLAQNACACIFYNEGAVLSCESGNCSQGRLVNCINQGGTWYNGAGQVPAGMTACDFFLPVTLSDFKGFNSGDRNVITWATESELNNDHFTLEKSSDGVKWDLLHYVKGGGTTSQKREYTVVDNKPSVITYYRLFQFDTDGEQNDLGVISVTRKGEAKVLKIYNLLGQEVNESYGGVKVYLYSDGTYKKGL